MALTHDDDEEVSVEIRDASPADYLLKIENFSVMLSENGIEKHESSEFESGGYKWKLILYPQGRPNTNAGGHISLYLALAELGSLPAEFEINASFNFFVFNQLRDNYLTIRGRTRRFHATKTEWGMRKFIAHETLTELYSGYLVDDICVFGVEVFVIKNKGIGQCLSLLKIADQTFKREWKVSGFSHIDEQWRSEEFTAGEHKWRIKMYPKGFRDAKNESISIYLETSDSKIFKPGRKVKADVSIFMKDQIGGEHRRRSYCHWFSAGETDWGWGKFMPLSDLNAESGGFILSDCCIVGIEMSVKCAVRETLT